MFGTPASSTARVMASASAAFMASGFSQATHLPFRAAAIAISAWESLGLPMSTSWTSSRSTTRRQSVSTDS